MNAKELHDALSATPMKWADIAAFVTANMPTILRALSLLAAAEANDGTTPETDALPQSDDKPIKEGAMARILCRRLERERNGLAAEVLRMRGGRMDHAGRLGLNARGR